MRSFISVDINSVLVSASNVYYCTEVVCIYSVAPLCIIFVLEMSHTHYSLVW